MLNEREARLTEALDVALQCIPVEREERLPVLIKGWVALAEALEEAIEFFCELRSLKAVPSILEPLTGQSEWEWTCGSVKDLSPETVVKVSVQQTLDWTIVLKTTDGEFVQLNVKVDAATTQQIQWAKEIVESVVRYKQLQVFGGSDEAWEDYVLSLESEGAG